MVPGELGLRGARFWQTEIVEAQLAREMRLMVAAEEWSSLRYVVPLGESSPPPFVVFRYWMKLRKVERDQPWSVGTEPDHRRYGAHFRPIEAASCDFSAEKTSSCALLTKLRKSPWFLASLPVGYPQASLPAVVTASLPS